MGISACAPGPVTIPIPMAGPDGLVREPEAALELRMKEKGQSIVAKQNSDVSTRVVPQ